MKEEQKKILVFGTFDGIHPGHIYFLNEAKKLGTLSISVASDESVVERKKKKPQKNTSQRIFDVKKLSISDHVSKGDRVIGKWSEIKKTKPDIVFLGYDQKELEKALLKLKKELDLNFIIKKGKAFKPTKYHSKIINKDCIFCTSTEIKKRIVLENNLSFVFPTNIPIVPGHLLVCPKRCVNTLEELSKKEKVSFFLLVEKTKELLKKTFSSEGFNIAWNEGEIAGQSVPHLHIHVLPRKKGDTGIIKYEPRKFLYRTGSREETPEKELLEVSKLIKNNL